MRRLISATLFMFITLSIIASSAPRAYAEALGCGPADVLKMSAHINEVTKSVNALASQGECDKAIALLREFDSFPLSPDATVCRYAIARALHKAGRYAEAADMLTFIVANDRYNILTPTSLSFLTAILNSNLKDQKAYGDYMAMLAVEYYPTIPEVANARKWFGDKLPFVPLNQMVLIDGGLGEASIFNRFFLGSTNFCQWDVIRTLGGNGFIVHDNHNRSAGVPPLSILKEYGLVIMNGGSQNSLGMSAATVADLMSYVEGGGRLLVVCGGTNCGGGTSAKLYNSLLRKLGLEFNESYTAPGTAMMCKPTTNSLMRGISQFQSKAGTMVSGGTPLGYCGNAVIISSANYGKGTVVAAGIGTGLMGTTIGDLYRNTPEKRAEAQINRTFLLKLVQNMMSRGVTSFVATPSPAVPSPAPTAPAKPTGGVELSTNAAH